MVLYSGCGVEGKSSKGSGSMCNLFISQDLSVPTTPGQQSTINIRCFAAAITVTPTGSTWLTGQEISVGIWILADYESLGTSFLSRINNYVHELLEGTGEK